MPTLEHLWSALEDARSEQAIRIAEGLFVRDPHAASNQEEAAQQLASLYRNEWRILPAIRFEEDVVPALGPSADVVLAPLAEELAQYHQWRERLANIALERLADEFRSAVKANDRKRAFDLALSVLNTANSPTQRQQRAKQIANILGAMIAEKERAKVLLTEFATRLPELSLDAETLALMFEEYERAAVAAFRRETATASQARVELTQAAVELSRSLPDRMALHEPTDADLERFMKAIRAIVAVCLTTPRFERYYEATLLFVEFSPKEVSTAGAMAGVEQRLYATLGRTARLAATKTFATVGSVPVVWQSYMRFACESIWNKRIAPTIVETIGLLRNPEGVNLLVKWANESRLDVRPEAIAALGSIASEQAIAELLTMLRERLREKVLTGEPRREAIGVVNALGRAARALAADKRSLLLRQVVRILPPNDHELAMRTALAFLQGNVENFDRELLNWAATVATRALWHVDRPELARQAKAAPLGFRQPLIDFLERLAPYTLDVINAVALEQAKTFCGAYLALGELYARVASPATLPVLRQLLINSFLHDDKPKTPYHRETILEPGTEERSELTRDKVLASLIYAVSKVQSEEADELLAELFEQVRSGRLPRPGQETADVLMQAYMRVGQKRGEAPLGVFPGAQTSEKDFVSAQATPTITEEEAQWLRDLDAKFLLSAKRRAKRVAALAGLAKNRTLAALPKVVEHLTDKDAIVAAAAATALSDYARPPVKPLVVERLHAELLHALQVGDNGLRKKIAEILERMGPQRSPLKDRLEALLQSGALDSSAREIVMRLLAASPAPATTNERRPGAAVTPSGNDAGATAGAKGPQHISELEKRRQYLLARQAWIRGGKKGPEPRPPE
ncbi:MAG: HEAT repeat domain-containing protein [Candidatus Sumerlaeaceae bacterium]|nr:HEAT repeat domain-containing protein [Candidatus Sumerlaeaceae bacterium]